MERTTDSVIATLAALDGLGVGGDADARHRALAAMAHAYRAGVYAPATPAGEQGLWRTIATVGLGHLPGGAQPQRVAGLAESIGRYFPWYRPVAGMRELVAEIRGGGGSVGIISNWPPSLPAFLEHQGFGSFPVLACSGALRCSKPEPTIFRWALERAGVEADASWYVGNDPEADYAPATALGMHAVLWDPAGGFTGSGARRAGSPQELRWLLGLRG